MTEQRTKKGGPIAAAFLAALLASFFVYEGDPQNAAGRHVSYQDGRGIWTICKGVTGPDIVQGLEWTTQQCMDRMLPMIEAFNAKVTTCAAVPLLTREHFAYLHFAWNIGTNAFCKSTLVKRLRAHDYAGACRQITVWKFSDGQDCSVRSSNCFGIWLRRLFERGVCEGYITVPGLI